MSKFRRYDSSARQSLCTEKLDYENRQTVSMRASDPQRCHKLCVYNANHVRIYRQHVASESDTAVMQHTQGNNCPRKDRTRSSSQSQQGKLNVCTGLSVCASTSRYQNSLTRFRWPITTIWESVPEPFAVPVSCPESVVLSSVLSGWSD